MKNNISRGVVKYSPFILRREEMSKLISATIMFCSVLGASVYTGEGDYLAALVFIPAILMIIEYNEC